MSACSLPTYSTLPSIETVSPLGFSAKDVLTFATKQYSSHLAWHNTGGGAQDLTYSPGPGETDVSLQFDYHDGAVRFANVATANPDVPESWCNDWLEIDAAATLTTADGALNETFDVTLSAWTLAQANWVGTIRESKINGSFHESVSAPGTSAVLKVTGSVTAQDTTGHIRGEFYALADGGGGAGEPLSEVIREYADWPTQSGCDGLAVPVDTQIHPGKAVSPQAMIDAVNSLPPGLEQYPSTDSGKRLTIHVTADEPTACLRHFTTTGDTCTGEWLSLSGRLNALSDDRSINTDLPIEIRGCAANSTNFSEEAPLRSWDWIRISVEAPYSTGVSPSELFSKLGFVEAAPSGYELATCEFDISISYIYKMNVNLYAGSACLQDTTAPGCVSTLYESMEWDSLQVANQ